MLEDSYIDMYKQPFGNADIGYSNVSPTKQPSVVLKSYYEPENSGGSQDRVKRFIEATKKSSDQQTNSSKWSSDQSTLKWTSLTQAGLEKSCSSESLDDSSSEVKTGIRVKMSSTNSQEINNQSPDHVNGPF